MSKIEWTDETWNVVTGCDRVSPGCDHCYIERTIPFRKEGRRFDEHGRMGIRLHPDRIEKPWHWRKPRKVFVNSLADLFHPDVPEDFIHRVWNTMAVAEQHTFQVLTKRPQRMATLLAGPQVPGYLSDQTPPANVWCGTSVETQRYADLRIPHLLATPAAVRFLSIEPLLGPVELPEEALIRVEKCRTCDGRGSVLVPGGGAACPDCYTDESGQGARTSHPIDWVIVGGESGPGARPMYPGWVRRLRIQCSDAGVPFFFKQWGEWGPAGRWHGPDHHVLPDGRLLRPGETIPGDEAAAAIHRWGKKAAGRELDGRTWDEYPESVPA